MLSVFPAPDSPLMTTHWFCLDIDLIDLVKNHLFRDLVLFIMLKQLSPMANTWGDSSPIFLSLYIFMVSGL